MEALGELADAAAAREALVPLVVSYREWIGAQRQAAPKGGEQGDVSDMLLEGAERAAGRIEAGIALLDEPLVFEAFRLANRAMAMAARQRRAQERGISPDQVEPPTWRPFQLAFLLMNLRAIAEPGARRPRDRGPAVLPHRRRQDRGLPGPRGLHDPGAAAAAQSRPDLRRASPC